MRSLFILVALWAVAAAPLWADCQLTKLNGIDAIFGPDRIYVSVKMNGKPALFIVDTASNTMLFQEPAEKLGVRFTGDAKRQTYGLTGKEMTDSRVVLDTFEVGPWKSSTVALRAVGPVSLGESEIAGVPVAGLMGDDLLSHFDVEINIREKLFALYQPQDCEKANMAYWTKDYNVAEIIRYTEQNPRVRVQAKLDGRTVTALVDSGSPFSLMSQDVAASHDVTPDSPGTKPAGMVIGMHGQPAASWVGTFKSFELDQEKIAPAKIDFFVFSKRDFQGSSRIQSQVFNVDMLLGFDFLRAHHVLISHSQQKVYFSYAGGAPFAAPAPDAPLEEPVRP